MLDDVVRNVGQRVVLRVRGHSHPDNPHDGNVVHVVADEADLVEVDAALGRKGAQCSILRPQVDNGLARPGEDAVPDVDAVRHGKIEPEIPADPVRHDIDSRREDAEAIARAAARERPPATPSA